MTKPKQPETVICSNCSTEFDPNRRERYIDASDDREATTTIGLDDSNDGCPTCGADPYGMSYEEFMWQEGHL